MQSYPHHYAVTATSVTEGDVLLESGRVPPLQTAPPEEFGGPGDRWSPETLCVGAVADCFILTFRAIARATKLPWLSLRCDVVGTLERVERVPKFTAFALHATLETPGTVDQAEARAMLERAERSCLITNSLAAPSSLEVTIQQRT
jgi:organic hydroperoxide reductase OsmC/OhrA